MYRQAKQYTGLAKQIGNISKSLWYYSTLTSCCQVPIYSKLPFYSSSLPFLQVSLRQPPVSSQWEHQGSFRWANSVGFGCINQYEYIVADTLTMKGIYIIQPWKFRFRSSENLSLTCIISKTVVLTILNFRRKHVRVCLPICCRKSSRSSNQ